MILLLITVAFLVIFLVYDWWKRREVVDGIHRRAVFITGCDTGFGNALAKSLYAKGVPVYAGCLTEQGAKKLEEETGDGLKTVIVDVTNTDSVRRAAAFVRDNIPNNVVLWGVVNNAGIAGCTVPVEFQTKDDYKQVMEVNLYGMIDVTIAFLPLLKKCRGRIVNMSSMAANVAYPNHTQYCASKSAATGFSDSLRVEKSVWGISVSTIQPGFFQTSMLNMEAFREKVKRKWMALTQDLREEYGDDYPDKTVKLTQNMLKVGAASDITPVIEALEHALFSVRPRAIYYPGFSAKLIKVMPYFIIDKLFLHYTKLPRCLRTK